MTYKVNYEMTAVDFRQNVTPQPVVNEANRHWMLDFAPARDLLKTKLRKSDISATVPIWSDGKELDAKLNLMIDTLGMRDMAEPESKLEQLMATAKFFKLMVLCQLSQSAK